MRGVLEFDDLTKRYGSVTAPMAVLWTGAKVQLREAWRARP
jgi:hypothetical protein